MKTHSSFKALYMDAHILRQNTFHLQLIKIFPLTFFGRPDVVSWLRQIQSVDDMTLH